MSFLAIVFSQAVYAANCDAYRKKAESTTGKNLIQTYDKLIDCDKNLAEDSFVDFMKRTNEITTLAKLSLTAIDKQVWKPTWEVPSKLKDYAQRDEFTHYIGAACQENDKVLNFLQGAYVALKDIEFARWEKAYISCENDTLNGWMSAQIEAPPQSSYQEKYSSLMNIYVDKLGADALISLEKAAISAAETGPFADILSSMAKAVEPSLGQTLSGADKEKLDTALLNIAQNVSPEKAKEVANRLVSAGSQDTAAKLLPTIYADRYNGSFTYGGVAIELATCGGEKTAVFHTATIKESGKLWLIQPAIQDSFQSFKPKLKKCEAEGETWSVFATPTPILNDKEITPWLESLQNQYEKKGYVVSVKKEKGITIQ
ncbi:MAG: hypothetical protein CMK59_09850 [Proteobacteria bacterium]|nr:hypothetical protein [Pseudomonadota bacterium]